MAAQLWMRTITRIQPQTNHNPFDNLYPIPYNLNNLITLSITAVRLHEQDARYAADDDDADGTQFEELLGHEGKEEEEDGDGELPP